MALDLQHGGLHARLAHDLLEHLVARVEVADAQRAHLAHGHGLLHVAPRAHEIAHGLVDVEQVDVVEPHAGEHLIDGLQGLALAVLRRPELRGDPYLAARRAAFGHEGLHGASHARLVVVGMGGVNVAVARPQRGEARLLAHFVRRLKECAQSELRHQYPVVELHERHIGGSLINILREGRGADRQSCAHERCDECVFHIKSVFNRYGGTKLARSACKAFTRNTVRIAIISVSGFGRGADP